MNQNYSKSYTPRTFRTSITTRNLTPNVGRSKRNPTPRRNFNESVSNNQSLINQENENNDENESLNDQIIIEEILQQII